MQEFVGGLQFINSIGFLVEFINIGVVNKQFKWFICYDKSEYMGGVVGLYENAIYYTC